MKPRRLDLRTEKTYAALFDAFNTLITTKSFEQLTVTELCRVARTRTATFYNHFSDKYDFFAFMIQSLEAQNLDAAQIKSSPSDGAAYLNEWLELGFDFIAAHAAMVASVQSDTLLVTIMQTTAESLISKIQKSLPVTANNQLDAELQSQLMIGALFQASRWWLAHRETISKQRVISQLEEFMQRFYELDAHQD